ncbi:MAG: hypothetical protein RhofKO_30190 [Rhodothermales bacterium]
MAQSTSKGITTGAYVAFALGTLLLGLTLVQESSDVQVLDAPWMGAIGFLLLAMVLNAVGKRQAPSGD